MAERHQLAVRREPLHGCVLEHDVVGVDIVDDTRLQHEESTINPPLRRLRFLVEFDDAVAHFSLAAFDARATPRVVKAGSLKSGKYLLSEPCVLFAKLNPRIPRIWNVMTLPPEMALASSEFVVLRPMGVDSSVLWAALRQSEVTVRLQRQAVGTAGSRQRIRPGDLLDVPVRDVRRLSPAASQRITSLGALCHARRAENVQLSAFRDTLLPLLMSGKVRVTDVPG